MKVKLKTSDEEKIVEMSEETFKTLEIGCCAFEARVGMCKGCDYDFFCKESIKKTKISEVKEMKNALENIKMGDTVFSTECGVVKVSHVNSNNELPIMASARFYTKDGKRLSADKHPSLFLSAKHASEYFANIKTKHTREAFINIYPNELLIYRSRATAMNSRLIDCITTIETTLEWES